MNRILLVEDEGGLREGLGELLRLHGFRVDLFESGTRALEFLETGPTPDAIVLDLVLRPDMNGWQFASAARRMRKLGQVPIIAVSGVPLGAEQLRQCEVNAFLPKPFEPEELMRVLETFLGESAFVGAQ